MSVVCDTLLLMTVPVCARLTRVRRRGAGGRLLAGDTPPEVTVPVRGRGALVGGRGTLLLLAIVRHTQL